MAYERTRANVVALVVAAGSLVVEHFVYLALGLATGVIAMCSWAPEWWALTYFALWPLIPVCAAGEGLRMRRLYLRRIGFR